MGTCDTCGNEYDKTFELIRGGKKHTFDCFECAIKLIAPHCSHCDCTIIGHGVESGDKMYCCAHCAKHDGEVGLKDRKDGGGHETEDSALHMSGGPQTFPTSIF